MEINIDNAIPIFVKVSLSPFKSTYQGVSQKIEHVGYRLLGVALEKPLLSTMIITLLMTTLLSVLTLPIVALTTVSCIAIVIIIIEGFILGIILILTGIITAIKIALFSLFLGCKLVYRKRQH